jgi:hypothetical protein
VSDTPQIASASVVAKMLLFPTKSTCLARREQTSLPLRQNNAGLAWTFLGLRRLHKGTI